MINIEKRHLVYFSIVAILSVGTFLVIAYTSPIPNPGHGGDKILVNFGGEEQTVQAAFDDLSRIPQLNESRLESRLLGMEENINSLQGMVDILTALNVTLYPEVDNDEDLGEGRNCIAYLKSFTSKDSFGGSMESQEDCVSSTGSCSYDKSTGKITKTISSDASCIAGVTCGAICIGD